MESQPINPAGQEPTILLYDTLGPGHADGHALARQIWQLEADGHTRVHVRINSAGGSVAQGYSLFAALRHTRMEVHTWADGLALSMAGLLFLAGSVRHMAPWGLLMLHEPLLAAVPGEDPAPDGNAELLARIRTSVLSMYQDATSLSADALSAMMEAETWLTASEAAAMGLATEVTGEPVLATEHALLQAARAENRFAALEAVLAQAQTSPSPPNPPLPLHAERGRGAFVLSDLPAERGAFAPPPSEDLFVESTPPSLTHTPLPLYGKGVDLRLHWTMRDWERRDPNGLAKLRAQDRPAFEALYKATYQM